MNKQTADAWLTNREFAEALQMKPESLHNAICRKGEYYGIQPAKTWNGRLRWPAEAVSKLLGSLK